MRLTAAAAKQPVHASVEFSLCETEKSTLATTAGQPRSRECARPPGGSGAEAVADARVGVEVAGAELATQVGHVHPQDLHVVGVLGAPDVDQDGAVGQQAPAVEREHAQEVELDRG